MRVPDFLEKCFDHILGLALVEADFFEKQIRKFCFGKRHPLPFSDAKLCCECLLQISHHLLHGGIDFDLLQCFLRILHHYAEGKAFLAGLDPAPDINVEETDFANDFRAVGGHGVDQTLQFESLIDDNGEVPYDRRLA